MITKIKCYQPNLPWVFSHTPSMSPWPACLMTLLATIYYCMWMQGPGRTNHCYWSGVACCCLRSGFVKKPKVVDPLTLGLTAVDSGEVWQGQSSLRTVQFLRACPGWRGERTCIHWMYVKTSKCLRQRQDNMGESANAHFTLTACIWTTTKQL
jgi:hypothetical protein